MTVKWSYINISCVAPEQHSNMDLRGSMTHLQDPLVLSKLGVKCAFLQRAEFEGEARSKFLNANFLLIFEDIPLGETELMTIQAQDVLSFQSLFLFFTTVFQFTAQQYPKFLRLIILIKSVVYNMRTFIQINHFVSVCYHFVSDP